MFSGNIIMFCAKIRLHTCCNLWTRRYNAYLQIAAFLSEIPQ